MRFPTAAHVALELVAEADSPWRPQGGRLGGGGAPAPGRCPSWPASASAPIRSRPTRAARGRSSRPCSPPTTVPDSGQRRGPGAAGHDGKARSGSPADRPANLHSKLRGSPAPTPARRRRARLGQQVEQQAVLQRGRDRVPRHRLGELAVEEPRRHQNARFGRIPRRHRVHAASSSMQRSTRSPPCQAIASTSRSWSMITPRRGPATPHVKAAAPTKHDTPHPTAASTRHAVARPGRRPVLAGAGRVRCGRSGTAGVIASPCAQRGAD